MPPYPQGRLQAGARWCTCTPWILLFSLFAEHYVFTESDTETPSDSFLQSEIRQQVLVFHKQTLDRYALQSLTNLWVCTPLEKILRAPMLILDVRGRQLFSLTFYALTLIF